MKRDKISAGEKLFYLGYCIITLGMPFLLKIVIKKAIAETREGGDIK